MKQKVVEIKCDRCGRTEYVPDTGKVLVGGAKELPEFDCAFQVPGEAYERKVYEDLCTLCKRVVNRSWQLITKLDKVREEREIAEEDAQAASE